MNPKSTSPLLLLLSSFTLICLATAQDRAPHGLAYENPTAFSPAAYDFFHPTTQQTNRNKPCGGGSSCSPLPTAAQVAMATESREGAHPMSHSGGNRIGAGTVASIVIGLATVAILTMTLYRVVATRRANVYRANSVKPEAGSV